MAKLNLGYTEGMNQDMGFDKRSPNQYYDAMNIKIINNGSNFCITNSDGEHPIDIPVIITDTMSIIVAGINSFLDELFFDNNIKLSK